MLAPIMRLLKVADSCGLNMAGGQDSTEALEACRRLIEGHKANHVPVVATRDSGRVGKGGSTCAPNKESALAGNAGTPPVRGSLLVAPLNDGSAFKRGNCHDYSFRKAKFASMHFCLTLALFVLRDGRNMRKYEHFVLADSHCC